MTSSMDLSFLSRLGWDFASRSRISTLYIDEAWLLSPFAMVKNCSELQSALQPLMGAEGPAEASGGDLGDILKNCVAATVSDVHASLMADGFIITCE